MENKDIPCLSMMNMYSKSFMPFMQDGLECNDQLLNVGFKTFMVGGTRWFVFKPTIHKRNWVMNFLFPLYKSPYNADTDIRIHSGFLASYLALRSEVHNVMQLSRRSTDYVFCGHSLGGALARLAAVDVQYNFGAHITVYTAGAPNIGNKAFETSFEKRIDHSIYYVTDKDPVPAVPPELLGYKRYPRIRLPRKYIWRFWLNHLPETYIQNLMERDASKEIL